MKHFGIMLFILWASVFAACNNTTQPETGSTTQNKGVDAPASLEIGTPLPKSDLKMADVSGSELSANEIKGENGLLVIFSCNECPYVIGWEDRYPKIAEFCQLNKIGLMVVNSNEAQRDKEDSPEAMKKHAMEKGYNFPYLLDKNHQLADALGATRTPDLFLFDKDLKLAYKGCIDDNMKEPEKVQQFYIKNAVNSLVAGQPIDPNVTKAVGCSIKRISKI
ncbi:thioredoxin family protein [Sphingobacteriales bacterium UPWRP_1]|nr:hypothetical protein BVG80_13170 [Sphingobacteriales bacterium TSM_CSM]PSJ77781.1 thioredoxin family protein [Sphingobacteriales bacterium UPWRP_1]